MEIAASVAVTNDSEGLHFVPAVFPDIFGEIDKANGWVEPVDPSVDTRSEQILDLSSAFASVLQHCWTDSRGKVRDPDAALRRFCAFSMVLRPDIFQNSSYAAMAKKLDCTKAAISKLAVEFSDKFDLHFRRSRSDEARETFSAAAKEAWKER